MQQGVSAAAAVALWRFCVRLTLLFPYSEQAVNICAGSLSRSALDLRGLVVWMVQTTPATLPVAAAAPRDEFAAERGAWAFAIALARRCTKCCAAAARRVCVCYIRSFCTSALSVCATCCVCTTLPPALDLAITHIATTHFGANYIDDNCDVKLPSEICSPFHQIPFIHYGMV